MTPDPSRPAAQPGAFKPHPNHQYCRHNVDLNDLCSLCGLPDPEDDASGLPEDFSQPPPPHAPSGEPDLETIRAEWVYFDSEGDPAAAQVHWLVAEVERLRAALAQRDQAIAELRGELAGCVTVAEEIERRHAAVAQLAATLTLARQQRDEYLRELKLTRPVAEAGRGVLACLRGSAHRNDLAPIVEVCRVLLTTSQVTDLTAALQALDAAFRARGETNG